ncbi:MAG: hypothetical protein K2N38_08135 [Oscillospiraceae bacterium]|nr:hypothetical protein [Oscillospiraceae bacterium]
MDDKIRTVFDSIHADDELKSKTLAYIAKKSHGYPSRRKMIRRRIITAVSAAACLVLTAAVGAKLFFTSTSYICIEINPSLELGINCFDRVVEVSPLNDDGRVLAESLNIKFIDYDAALERIMDNSRIETLLSQNEIMTITVIDTENEQSSVILSNVKACADRYENVCCDSASSSEAAAAREIGLPCGKYRAYLELLELDSGITPEEVNEMTMREIYELIGSLSDNRSDSEHSSGHNGHGWHGSGHH